MGHRENRHEDKHSFTFRENNAYFLGVKTGESLWGKGANQVV